MFDFLRRNMKAIMWFTAGAFVLLIFLAWGAEYQLGSKKGREQGVIGRVNGEAISWLTFQDRLGQAQEAYRQQGRELDAATTTQIELQTWDALVQDMLINQEIRRLGIDVSDQEVLQAIRNQPLPFITQSPAFQTDGKFDYSKYLTELRNPERDWRPVESYYRQDLPKQKLQQLVTSSVKISEADVRRQYDMESRKAAVAYAYISSSRFEGDADSIETSELQTFYQAHSEDYWVGERAWVEYVRIEKKATSSDTLNARDLIQLAAQEARDGEDFDILVKAYSEAPPSLQGGDAGSYLPSEQYAAPKVREAAFSLQPGQISGILEESNGYHLIRVEDKRNTDEKEEVKIADIFVPITLSAETLVEVQARATTLAGAAIGYGGDLTTAAAEYPGMAVTAAGPFGRTGYLPSLQRLGQIGTFRDWAFNAAVGSIVRINGPEAWYVIHLTERRPAGVPPLAEVEKRARSDYASSLKSEQAFEKAQTILNLVDTGMSLEEAAATDTMIDFGTTEEFARRGFDPGLGNDPAIMGRIFSDPVGLIPAAVKTRRGAYVIEILSRTDPDTTLFEAQKATIRQQLSQRLQSQILNRWMEGLRSSAEIEDYRGEVEI